MDANAHDWNHRLHKRPDPATVAKVVQEYGWEAALERWSWLTQRGLSNLVVEAGGKVDLKR